MEAGDEHIVASPKGETDVNAVLLAAGRLETRLASRPDQISSGSRDVIAWSSSNLIAIADSNNSIRLTPLSNPKRQHILATQEKPSILSFSPRGDALFASFRRSRTNCLWTRDGYGLNEWCLKHTWTNWQGRVLEIRWLGERRAFSSKLERRPAKGPQFAAGELAEEAGAVVVCDNGQVIAFHGSIAGTGVWQVHMNMIPISSQERIAKVGIGLVPDEPVLLLAYTMRLSSQATMPRSMAEGDALGMFFEDADDAIPMENDRDKETSQRIDGQDKIELLEVQLDLASSPSRMMLRPLWPIYLASFEAPSLPNALSTTSLIWVDVDNKSASDHTQMKLFVSFFAQGNTTVRTWDVQREETETLSEAFSKLEAAKSKVTEEEGEDWAARSGATQTHEGLISDHYQLTPSGAKILCSWIVTPPVHTLEEVTKPILEFKLIDPHSLQISDDNAFSNLGNPFCKPALSPNGALAAQIIDGRVTITQAIKEVHFSTQADIALAVAILGGVDTADLRKATTCDYTVLASALKLNEKVSNDMMTMIEVVARSQSSDAKIKSLNARILLQLVFCFRKLSEAEVAGTFDPGQLWFLVSSLDWILQLLESLARQAYLEHASLSVTSPGQLVEDEMETRRAEKDEPDMLALFTLPFPRKLLTDIILRLIRFCNWLQKVNKSKEGVKKLMSSTFLHPLNKISSDGGGESTELKEMWGLADNLRLAQMQVSDWLLKSAVDLSQAGRRLRTFKIDKDDMPSKWWLSLAANNRTKLAQAFVDGDCIRNPLQLFCPPEGEEPVSRVERDVFTSARLPPGTPHILCLTCSSKSRSPSIAKCICGAQSWWKVT